MTDFLKYVFTSSTKVTRIGTRSSTTSTIGWTCRSCLAQREYGALRTRYTAKRAFTATIRRPYSNSERHNATTSDGQLSTPAATSRALPSHTAKRRSTFTTRLSQITDSILARASVAGQHINTYTGTDFSGIEGLRKEISEQESEVKNRHAEVSNAKEVHREARSKQAASQKEIVGLLERKSSWTPGDLERYMALVRSEHDDDQLVQRATEQLAVAERGLEGTRSLLEKLERKQYHEEQIWSDTIRRNSTWVTIGLMGVNILLLLAQIAIFEPYRRRKIVKQIKEAFDERTPALNASSTDIEKEVDLAIDPQGVTLEQIQAENVLSEMTASAAGASAAALPSTPTNAAQSQSQPCTNWVERARNHVSQLFSDEPVLLKRLDLTTIALEGAATGMAAAGVIALLVFKSAN